MSATADAAGGELSQRHVRALTETMYVHADDPDAWGDHEVAVYSEDRQYLVNVAIGYCDCADAHYRDVECKHVVRAKYTLGVYDVPAWVRMDRLDDHLRERLEDSA